MNFSERFKVSRSCVYFSPDGDLLARCCGHRVLIHQTQTMEVYKTFNCKGTVEHTEWSPDGEYLLTALYKLGSVQIWSIKDTNWKGKIDEGTVGLVSSRWSPDSRHILNISIFHLRVTVWSLTDKSVFYLKYPKQVEANMSFTSDGKLLALAERRADKDAHFKPLTTNMSGIFLSPDDVTLCVCDGFADYSLHFYSLEGHHLSSYSRTDCSLGARSVQWSPTGQFIAVGGHDDEVVVLNYCTWKPVLELTCEEDITSECVVYKEEKIIHEGYVGNLVQVGGLPDTQSTKYRVVSERPVKIPRVNADPSKYPPALGIKTLSYSSDGRYLACLHHEMPSAVWVWDIKRLLLKSVLLHLEPVQCLAWEPVGERLVLCTGSDSVYVWSPGGCLVVRVPRATNLNTRRLLWHPRGGLAVVLSHDQMCLCFFSKTLLDSQDSISSFTSSSGLQSDDSS